MEAGATLDTGEPAADVVAEENESACVFVLVPLHPMEARSALGPTEKNRSATLKAAQVRHTPRDFLFIAAKAELHKINKLQ